MKTKSPVTSRSLQMGFARIQDSFVPIWGSFPDPCRALLQRFMALLLTPFVRIESHMTMRLDLFSCADMWGYFVNMQGSFAEVYGSFADLFCADRVARDDEPVMNVICSLVCICGALLCICGALL